MPIQNTVSRAIGYCRLCRNYATFCEASKDPTLGGFSEETRFSWDTDVDVDYKSLRDIAKNRAITTLEHSSLQLFQQALQACDNCDYREPRIAKLLEQMH